ncbi:hypothetical protein Tco_1219674 [Tanacetum coccineum]
MVCLEHVDAVDIPMVGQSKLDEDPNGTPVDPTPYQGMVGSLMYLTVSRPNLVFAICMCAWYQEKKLPKKHFGGGFCDSVLSVPQEEPIIWLVTDYQLADIFTKALVRERFKFMINRLNMQRITPEELKRLAESDKE